MHKEEITFTNKQNCSLSLFPFKQTLQTYLIQ